MFNVGDRVQYVRNKDGLTVVGVIVEVHHNGSDKSRFMFLNDSLVDETTAYRLKFDGESEKLFDFPVRTVGAYRVTATPS